MDPIARILSGSMMFNIDIIFHDKFNGVKSVVDLGDYRIEANGGIGLPDL
jgi:hypothetical protein